MIFASVLLIFSGTFHVFANDSLTVTVTDGPKIPGIGDSITINVMGSVPNQILKIEIIADNNALFETLTFPASSQGIVTQPWIIPKDIDPGTYVIRVDDGVNVAETSFVVKDKTTTLPEPSLSEKQLRKFQKQADQFDRIADRAEINASKLLERAEFFISNGNVEKAEKITKHAEDLLGKAFVLRELANTLRDLLESFMK